MNPEEISAPRFDAGSLDAIDQASLDASSLETEAKSALHAWLYKLRSEFEIYHEKVTDRQAEIRTLHQLQKTINNQTSQDGSFKCEKSDEIYSLLEKTREKHGISVEADKTAFTKEERDRLIENLKMTIDDLQVMNDMDLQKLSQVNNDWNQAYGVVMNAMRPMHDTLMSMAKKIGG